MTKWFAGAFRKEELGKELFSSPNVAPKYIWLLMITDGNVRDQKRKVEATSEGFSKRIFIVQH
jgi:hypothetical protein